MSVLLRGFPIVMKNKENETPQEVSSLKHGLFVALPAQQNKSHHSPCKEPL